MKHVLRALFCLYSLALTWLVLFKFSDPFSSAFDANRRSLNLLPFAGLSVHHVLEPVLNVLVFVPFGLSLPAAVKRSSFLTNPITVAVASVAFELTQYVFAIGATDINDTMANTLGGFFGLLLYRQGSVRVGVHIVDRLIAFAAVGVLLAGMLGAAVVLPHGIRYHTRR